MKALLFRGFTTFAAVALLATPAVATQMSFIAVLSGAQESPPVTDTNGRGSAYVTLDTATREVCYAIHFDGLSGAAVAMHFHGPGAARNNADVTLDLSSALVSPIAGCATGLSAAQMSDLRAGLWYLNVHTAANPGGEIRGQVERVGTSRASRGGGRLPIR